jgi:K+-transporting ATPase ATPase C chain
VGRIARVRHLPEKQVRQLVDAHIHSPLGFLGESTINVLELNRALDVMTK